MCSYTSKLFYKLFGPTTIHLQHEFVLLATLSIFTSASFYTTYHSNKYFSLSSASNNGSQCHWNECIYIVLSTIWLSRHLVHRIMCTTEVSTSTKHSYGVHVSRQMQPSWLSMICKLWIWLTSGGQYYDVPCCPFQLTLHDSPSAVKALATSNSSSKYKRFTIKDIIQTANVKKPVGLVDHRQMSKSNSETFLNSNTPPIHRIFIIQIFFIVPMIVVPMSISKYLLIKLSSRKRSTRGYYDSDSDDDFDFRPRNADHRDDKQNSNDLVTGEYIKIHLQTQNQVNQFLDSIWKFTPSIQFVIFFFAIASAVYIGFKFYSARAALPLSRGTKSSMFEKYSGFQQDPSSQYMGRQSIQSQYLNADLMAQQFEKRQQIRNGSEPRGIQYQYGFQSIIDIFYDIAGKVGIRGWKSTFYSPWGMAYMICCWGIVSSLFIFGRVMLPLPDLTAGRDSWIGKGHNKSHKMKRKDKIWCEEYLSIANCSRFSLHLKIILIRVIESVIVCAALPQSSYICKATGYCNIEPTIFEIGNPTAIDPNGIHSKNEMFDNIIRDHLIGKLIFVSVLVTSVSVLIGQTIVLDRSSLSLGAYTYLQGYLSNNHSDYDGATNRKGGGRRANTGETPFVWNTDADDDDTTNRKGGAHRRSNPNDFMLNDHWKNFTHHNEDGNRHTLSEVRNLFFGIISNELGALSTSTILSYIFSVYAVHAVLVITLTLLYSFAGMDCYPLVLILIAIFSAAGGSDVDTLDFDEIEEVANEINALYDDEK